MLTTQMQKWGNSYGVRIPKAVIEQLELSPDTRFEVRQEAGNIILVPVSSVPTLEELLSGISPENLHSEVDFGPAEGREIW
jgi:antitoxin MazE